MRGYIKQRNKGSWTIVLYMGRDPQTGKKKYQWKSIKGTKKQAEKRLAEMLTQIEEGTYIKSTRITVGEFLLLWLKNYAATNTSPRTSERYGEMIRLHLIPNLGRIQLSQLRPDHIQELYTQLLVGGRVDGKGGLSPRSVQHIHRVLSEALNHAVKWGFVARNVSKAIDPPRPEKKEINTIDWEDFPLLLKEASKLEESSGIPYFMVFHAALHTGMRRGELLGLRWCDIDLDMCTISVNRSLQVLKTGTVVIREPKTPKARRLIDMTPSLAVELREYKSQQDTIRLFLGNPLTNNDLVFAHTDGTPLIPDSISAAFKKVAKRAGFSLNLHSLRHSHATLMFKSRIHPKIVSDRLGHATVAFTLDTYSHVVPGLQAAAALIFDNNLNDAVSSRYKDEATLLKD